MVNAEGTSNDHAPAPLAVVLPTLTPSTSTATVAPGAAVPATVGVTSLKFDPLVGVEIVGDVMVHALLTHADPEGQLASDKQRTHALSEVRQFGVAPKQSVSAKQPEISVNETVGLAALDTANTPEPTLAVA